MAEIDDIFASKPKAGPPPHSPRTSLKKKKKDKKNKQGVTSDIQKEPPIPTNKRPLPETIVDPSTLPNNSKRHRSDSDTNPPSKRKRDLKEEGLFKDSRGTGPRRKTEEGWNIYKADELGLNDEGGVQTRPFAPLTVNAVFDTSMNFTLYNDIRHFVCSGQSDHRVFDDVRLQAISFHVCSTFCFTLAVTLLDPLAPSIAFLLMLGLFNAPSHAGRNKRPLV